jgi:hypothetical protein
MRLRGLLAQSRHGAIGPSVPTDENRARIDAWVAAAPDTRVVESTQAGTRWTSQALEDGQVRYEETEIGRDEAELNLLARWCQRQVKPVDARPPVKTSGVPSSGMARTRSN